MCMLCVYYVGGVHTCLFVFMGPKQDIWYPGASLSTLFMLGTQVLMFAQQGF